MISHHADVNNFSSAYNARQANKDNQLFQTLL